LSNTTTVYFVISFVYFNGYMFQSFRDHNQAIVQKRKVYAVQFM